MTDRAVFQEAGALVAEANLGGADLVAGVAIRTVGHACCIGELHASAVLRDALALNPIADEAVFGIRNIVVERSLNFLGNFFIDIFARHIGF